MPVNYDVPMLFSKEYTKGLKALNVNGNDVIRSVYGSSRINPMGQARYSSRIPDLINTELVDYISEVRDCGIEFHYTVNSPWANLRERCSEDQKRFLDDVLVLKLKGIDALVLANPYLIKLVRTNIPELKIIASINLQTNSLYKYEALIEYGCSSVVLDRTLNRNFSILKNLQKINGKYSLLANSLCLFDCPLQQYHANENGAMSSGCKPDIIDSGYCSDYCISIFKNEPWNILKSSWIRPEDISFYERLGVESFKIQGRTLEVEVILGVIQAYLNRKTPDDKFLYIFPGYENLLPGMAKQIKNSRLDELDFPRCIIENKINCAWDCGICKYCRNVYSKLSDNEVL